jgi:hypothetical protein
MCILYLYGKSQQHMKGCTMNNHPNSKWFTDAALSAIFLAAFFQNQTGLSLHQWIGVAAAALAAYHLETHWDWIGSVTRRFFRKTSNRARIYYLFDAGILVGFCLIGITGLAISSWLNLSLNHYDLWRNVHVYASILTLILTGIKIGIHWRWIAATARKIFARSMPQTRHETPLLRSVPAAIPITSRQQMSRSDFLKVIGIVGIASFLALRSAASSLATSAASQTLSDGTTDISSSASASGTSGSQTALSGPTSGSTSSQACTIQCGRRCSFPGQCRRYVDGNGNGYCDNGECL